MLSAILLAPVAGILASLLAYLIRRDQKLSEFPGPTLARFSDLWQLWFMYKDCANEPYRALHKRYGSVVRMAPNKLYFSEPSAIQDIYGLRKDLKKSEYYSVSAPVANGYPVTNFFASTDAIYHDRIRRAVQQPFNMSSVLQYERSVDKIVALFISQLQKRFADKTTEDGICDLPRWVHYFALDAVNSVAYSSPYGFLEADEDLHGMIKDIEANLTYQVYVGQAPWLDKLLVKNPLKLWLGRRGLFNHVSPPVPLAAMALEARFSEVKEKEKDKALSYSRLQGTGRQDLLDKLVRISGELPDVIDETEILKVGLSVVFAGADSTASMITAVLYHLLKSPASMQRLWRELDEQVYSKLRADEAASFTELQRVTYLDACIMEAMRRFPVVRFTTERVTPPGGVTIAGKQVPGNVVVGANPWALHHDSGIFGAETDQYRPERWLRPEVDDAKYREMAATLMVFGFGKYSCIGRNIAMLEIFKVVPEVIRRFHISLVDDKQVWRFKHGLFINLADVDIRLTSRAP